MDVGLRGKGLGFRVQAVRSTSLFKPKKTKSDEIGIEAKLDEIYGQK